MSGDPHSSDRPPDAPPPDEVARAAAIDDFFGGFAEQLPEAAPVDPDTAPLPASLDLLLLLRQAGARGAPPKPAMPAAIGRYRILGLAGRGGFSVVWEAFDPVLRRRVAVKSCSPDALASPDVRRRFRREAELASRLVHPHIVTIHEVGEADGLEFITSEFCEGGSLADWLDANPGSVPPRVAARIAQALAHAAAHAHAAGVVHRDIKPANVMLVPVDGHDLAACVIPPSVLEQPPAPRPGMTVKLGDFGLGRQDAPLQGENPLTQLTTDGTRLGTPAWMAPEQIDRSFGAVGPPTDVHAIGLVLDRMLTGRPLRGGTTDVETYREVLLDDPIPADRINRAVSPDLAAICLACLAKRPGDRYASAAALADDLGRWLAGQPTRVRPLTPFQRLGRRIARRPLVAALVGAAVLATALAGWTGLERDRERRTAAVRQEEIRRQTAAAELRRGFESWRSANVAGALEQLAKARASDPELASSIAGRWLERRLHGEQEILLRPAPAAGGANGRTDLHCLAISADGTLVAAGGADGVLRLLRRSGGRTTTAEIRAHDEINDVCVSSDGRMVASAGQDGWLRWWSIDEPGRPAGEVPPKGGPLYAVAFSTDDSRLWYGGEDRMLRRVEVTPQPHPEDVHRLPSAEERAPEIEAIACLNDLVLVACGGSLTAFDPARDVVLWSYRRPELGLQNTIFHALAVSPSGDRIAIGGTDREMHILEAASGVPVAALPAHPHWIQACRFSPDGRQLATACRDGMARVFDTSTGALVAKLVGHAGRIWELTFESNEHLVTAGADGTLRRWPCVDVPTAPALRPLAVVGHSIMAVREIPPAGKTASGGRLLALRHGRPPLEIEIDGGVGHDIGSATGIRAVGIAVDQPRRRVAFGVNGQASDVTPPVLSLDDGLLSRQPVAAPGGAVSAGEHLCWTGDGRLVSCSHDLRIFVWSPALDQITSLGRVDDFTNRLEACPVDPTRVAAAGKPGVVLGLGRPMGAGAALVRLDDVEDPITALAWSPDGTMLACGLRNGALHLFRSDTGRLAGTLAPHERKVIDVFYAPDGRAIVTADADCIRIYDAATLTMFDELRPGWQIESMCLAADGRFVAVGGHAPASNPDDRARLAILDLDSR